MPRDNCFASNENMGKFSQSLINLVNDNYLYISPLGEMLYGFEGFSKWANSVNQQKNLEELMIEYKSILDKASKSFNELGVIDATERINQTFSGTFLDKLYYLDFYALPKFGKTKLGQLVLYSKQSQKYDIIKSLSLKVKPKIEEVITLEKVNAISFIPPTIPRNLQFIKEFEKTLNISLPKIKLSKAYIGDIPVAQKTLSRLEERTENASKTIFIKDNAKYNYNKVLLVDDAVGSGSSLNETAKKFIREGIAKKVIGLAIVGSYKGFDVIKEV